MQEQGRLETAARETWTETHAPGALSPNSDLLIALDVPAAR